MDVWGAVKPFATGSIAGSIATSFIQPIDMIKVRIQLAAGTGGSSSPFVVAKDIVAADGVGGLYKGLSAGLLRQVLYTGARLGLFDVFTASMRGEDKNRKLAFWELASCSLAAGALGSLVGNPADLSLIRMQADSTLPAAERRGYRHVGDALTSILKSDGPAGLFAGAAPTMGRAMALNFGMLTFNDIGKQLIVDNGLSAPGTNTTVFGASALAGFMGAVFSLPADFIKTQMQKQKPDANGVLPYKSSLDCIGKTMAQGGPLRFYAGFPTYYFRIAPHAMVTLIAQDQVKKQWARLGI